MHSHFILQQIISITTEQLYMKDHTMWLKALETTSKFDLVLEIILSSCCFQEHKFLKLNFTNTCWIACLCELCGLLYFYTFTIIIMWYFIHSLREMCFFPLYWKVRGQGSAIEYQIQNQKLDLIPATITSPQSFFCLIICVESCHKTMPN